MGRAWNLLNGLDGFVEGLAQQLLAFSPPALASRRSPPRLFRPSLEGLEDRCVPAVYDWVGPDGGPASVGAYWYNEAQQTTGAVPGPADTAQIGFNGVTTNLTIDISQVGELDISPSYAGVITVATNFSVAATVTQGGGTLNLTTPGTTVSFGGVFTQDAGATMTVGGPGWMGMGPVTFNVGTMWESGAVGLTAGSSIVTGNGGGGGNLFIQSGGALTVAAGAPGSPPESIAGYTHDSGTLSVSTGAALTQNGPFDVLGGGTVNVGTGQGPSTALTVSGAGTTFYNMGALNMDGGALTADTIKNVGTLNVVASSTLAGSVQNFGGTISYQGGRAGLVVNGNYAQDAAGSLALRLFGSGGAGDALTITGLAQLDGTFTEVEVGGAAFSPPFGYAPISWGSRDLGWGSNSGQFATINLPADTNPAGWTVDYTDVDPISYQPANSLALIA
jgi:hypothetical protein